MSRQAEVVICGAGIAGVAVAYFLSARHGIGDILLVDERPPLSLTSDKSTECYRNWWPGPGDAMVRLMNRSIDLLEQLAATHGNCFLLNRRGYLYTTTDPQRVADLEGFAREASSLGAGEMRWHSPGASSFYQPHTPEGWQDAPSGADLITDPNLIRKQFPYLSEQVVAVLHVRRAGWLSAQQYGMLLLEQSRLNGVTLLQDRVVGVSLAGGRVDTVHLAAGGEVNTKVFTNAAGPLLAEVAAKLGVELPIFNELHMKASITDALGVVGRAAPLLIDVDAQTLEWSTEERAWLEEDPQTRWLVGLLPSGAHVRPEGGAYAQSIIMLWDTHNQPVEPVMPAPHDAHYPEIALRGLCKMLPGMRAYLERMPKPFIDSGYYTKTRENRPLACPLPIAGAYVIGAMSGYGIMASAGLSELVAAHVTGAPLPDYAPAFNLDRYQDQDYLQLLRSWGDSWQL